MCHIECGGKCCLRSADAVFCSILLRFAGDSTLLCVTDHEEVIWSLGIVGNALRSRQEVAMLQSVLQPRSLPEKPAWRGYWEKKLPHCFPGICNV